MELTLYGVDLWAAIMVFARIGAMLMLLPAFGEPAIPARIRLSFALLLTIVLTPGLANAVPAPAVSALAMSGQIIVEILIGVLFGAAARILVAATATAGQILGYEVGIAFAQTADPTQSSSGQLFSVFLGLLGVALIFATGLDHMFLAGVAGTYQVVALGAAAPVEDGARMALEATASSFRVAFQIAAPAVAAGLIFRVGLGVLSRLIPQIQVFFVVLPLQIMGGLVVVALGLSTGMLIWLDSLSRYGRWLE